MVSDYNTWGTLKSNLRALLFVCLSQALLFMFFSPLSVAIADILDEATEILGGADAHIKRWEFPPQFVVVYDSDINRLVISGEVERISGVTGMQLPEVKFIKLSDFEINEAFFDKTSFDLLTPENEMVFARLRLGEIGAQEVLGNIFVFLVSKPLASYFMIASSYGDGGNSLERQYISGDTPCFFSVLSMSGEMFLSTIFIDPRLPSRELSACVYEEFSQSMGLIRDYPGSQHFNYDNAKDAKEQKDPRYDELLLSALYDIGVERRSSVEVVVRIFRGLIENAQ